MREVKATDGWRVRSTSHAASLWVRDPRLCVIRSRDL